MATITGRLDRLEKHNGGRPTCSVCGDAFRLEIHHIVDGNVTHREGEVCPACGSPDRTIIEFEIVEARRADV